jgi:hypothetical protein
MKCQVLWIVVSVVGYVTTIYFSLTSESLNDRRSQINWRLLDSFALPSSAPCQTTVQVSSCLALSSLLRGEGFGTTGGKNIPACPARCAPYAEFPSHLHPIIGVFDSRVVNPLDTLLGFLIETHNLQDCSDCPLVGRRIIERIE